MNDSRYGPRGIAAWATKTGGRVGAAAGRLVFALMARWRLATARSEAGMATAEYAIATLATVSR